MALTLVMLVCLRINTRSSLLCRCDSSVTRRQGKSVLHADVSSLRPFSKWTTHSVTGAGIFTRSTAWWCMWWLSDNHPLPRGWEWTIERPQGFEMKTAAGHTQLKYIKGDLICPFIFLLSFSVILTVRKRKSETTEGPLYHRKHGSRNTSSVVPPLTSRYITMSHICIK